MNSIRLEIYLNQNNQATGKLYIDDGESYDYQNSSGDGYAEIKFTYESGNLTSVKQGAFQLGINQKVAEIAIYGLQESPSDIRLLSESRDFVY